MATLKLGTRGSQLALFQANTVAALLLSRAGVSCEIVVIKTSGDRLAEAPLSDVGGKRLFVKEIEDALLSGDVDLAVHSSKDMPVVLPDGLEISAVLPREDPRDALVLPAGSGLRASGSGYASLEPPVLEPGVRSLEPALRIGTSSVRRIAQLARLYPSATFAPIRGNLDTRLRKLDTGDYDALVLAAAGLRRLDRGDRISSAIDVNDCVPAPGQGIIAIETRAGDIAVRDRMAAIDDAAAALALRAERAVVTRLGGGCQMPIGAYAEVTADTITLRCIVTSLDGSRVVRSTIAATAEDPEAAGAAAATELLARGAGDILSDVQRTQASVGGLQP